MITPQQKLIVLQAYNKTLDSPLIDLYIRKKIRGQDLRLSQLIKKVPPVGGLKQECLEELWVFVNDENIRGLDELFKPYYDTFDTIEDWEPIKESLDNKVKIIIGDD